MNDMERRKFEDSFKDAFQDAALTPSEKVWTNVELDLERESGNKMKRRILFYKLLAAASVAFAMVAGGIGYYGIVREQQNNSLAYNAAKQKPLTEESVSQEKTNTPKESSPTGATETRSSEINATPRIVDSGATGSNDEDIVGNAGATSDKTQIHDVPDGSVVQKAGDQSAANNVVDANRKLKPRTKSPYNSKEVSIDNNVASNDPKNVNTSIVPLSGAQNIQQGNAGANAKTSEEATYGQTTVMATNTAKDGEVSMNEDGSKSGVDVKSDPFMVAANTVGEDPDNYVSIQDHRLPKLVTLQKIEFVDPRKSSNADPYQLMMARLNDEQRLREANEKNEKRVNRDENLWTSVGFAAGSFNTVNGRVSSSENNAVAVNSIADQQAKASGSAYSVGLSFGTKISARWVVQGGVNYMSQSSEYTASGLIGNADNNTFSVASVKELTSLFNAPETMANAKYYPSATYGITNSLEFISVPVQAGYLVLNRKVGIQINAGVSTDLFIQNTLATDGVDETTQRNGADSPYRPVNFSGLFGTEFSYRLGSHYRLALNPGMRYPFNSIYKSDIGIEATPLTFDVGLKFRYIFH